MKSVYRKNYISIPVYGVSQISNSRTSNNTFLTIQDNDLDLVRQVWERNYGNKLYIYIYIILIFEITYIHRSSPSNICILCPN